MGRQAEPGTVVSAKPQQSASWPGKFLCREWASWDKGLQSGDNDPAVCPQTVGLRWFLKTFLLGYCTPTNSCFKEENEQNLTVRGLFRKGILKLTDTQMRPFVLVIDSKLFSQPPGSPTPIYSAHCSRINLPKAQIWSCYFNAQVPSMAPHCLSNNQSPRLVWLSGLSTGLWMERSLVWFRVRAHAWLSGQVPSWGHVRGNQLMYLLHIDVFLPLFLPPFPSLQK